MKKKIAALAFLSLIAAAAQSESLVDGSAEAGKARSITCGACHGANGNSVNPEWPSLAGQHAGYTYDQLMAFKRGAEGKAVKSGARVNALMSGQAMMLSDQDMRDLGVYFESQTLAARAVADPASVDKGEALYRGGDRDAGLSACIACHGPNGRGNPAAGYPSIAGQYAVYTAKQLRDYASGARVGVAPTRIMRDVASRLSEEDTKALSSYIQGLY
jgi:cytochrome c553